MWLWSISKVIDKEIVANGDGSGSYQEDCKYDAQNSNHLHMAFIQ